MKTKSSIEIDFNQAICEANNLRAAAEQLDSINRRLDQIVNELSTSWRGESADLYACKCRELREKIRRSTQNLDQIASVIRRTAQIHHDAELRALEAVQNVGTGKG
ncbi:MAG: WXG100 family type VII secretion target [Lachnospiraceae bacterium]|nr:WXG100 family type VII secretion target [Lachnospiraceae bacterium]